MRLALARWWSPPFRSERGGAASNCSCARRYAAAMPPRPPPVFQRNCLREREVIGILVDEHELVAVEEHADGVRQAVLLRVLRHELRLLRVGRARQGQQVERTNLLWQIV